MKKAIAFLIVIILALIAGFAGGVYYANNHSDHYNAKAIEEKIIEISELATFEWSYSDEGEYTGDPKHILGFDIPFTKKAMIIRYSGTVKMGPKLKDNMKVDLDETNSAVTVTIPHSEILSHEVDEDSIEIVYVKNGIFNSVTPENTNELRKEMKKKKEKSIKDSVLLDQADALAVEQITTFLNSVYPDLNVNVEVK